jgi:hypothetical protein
MACVRNQSDTNSHTSNVVVVLQLTAKKENKEVSKYAVKPPKDLASKFEAKLAAKARGEEEALEKKRRDEEAAKIAVRFFVLSQFRKC